MLCLDQENGKEREQMSGFNSCFVLLYYEKFEEKKKSQM